MLLLTPNLYLATAAHWFRTLVLASVIIFGTACGSLSSSATLNMDVPANIRVDAEAYYQPISSHYCFVPENYPSAPNVGVKKFSQPAKPTAHTSKFDVKLLPSLGGCLSLLSGIKLWIMDMTEDPERLGLSAVWIHVDDLADEELRRFGPDENLLSVDCKYSDSRLSKVFKQELECKGQTSNDKVLGTLGLAQIQDKTLRLRVRMTE
ncbi:hypothetical protein C3E98_020360 [Pseudomonas sp. MWU13-2625]|nr:hypothetical protein C3E98_020360 [Pseudomonas sp. MWU13-2625]